MPVAVEGARDVQATARLAMASVERDSILSVHRTLHHDSPDVMREMISGKVPLDTYLERGLRLARADRFDIEQPLA